MRVRKSAEERKSEIVETALRLADKDGPDRLSTETIARTIHLTQAAIFRHFPTKQNLWEAVAARIGEKFQQRWESIDNPDVPAHEKLQALITSQLKLIQSTPAIPAILLSRELHAENARLRKLFYGMMEHFHGRITGLTEEGKQSGHFRDNLDPRDASFLIIGLVQGLVLRWSLSGRTFNLAHEGSRLLSVLLGTFSTSHQQTRSFDAQAAGLSVEEEPQVETQPGTRS
ncbi:MAG: TetR/AcrR family transcriptional regulator [Alphaproteobacteria bacterium HGW-Alphaproteobacteria-5]|nr:MAG: TetR/AcrR family transcriptional regulator [Alphaproteobacteria bacterium HGW-Alphaproteobacteria-5]